MLSVLYYLLGRYSSTIQHFYMRCVSRPYTGGNVIYSQQEPGSALQKSRWFTRGWTLQELLAPSTVEFFSREGIKLSDKLSLVEELRKVTGIPTSAL